MQKNVPSVNVAGDPMRVTPEQIEQARKIDLLSYLQAYEPDNLQKVGNSTYSTKEHDSLKISNGVWHWFSHHIGGKSALDYLVKVKGYGFIEAVITLAKNDLPVVQSEHRVKEDKKEFALPPMSEDTSRVRSYLLKRGINGRLIDYCFRQGILFEDAEYHNCVFIGKDEKGEAKYGALRGTVGSFKRELDGSDKRYSFRLEFEEKAEHIHLFESAIDLLSFITLEYRKQNGWQHENYLSLAGVYATENSSDIPLALEAYLEHHPETNHITCHLDNDDIGRKATEQIISSLGDRYVVDDMPPAKGKDFNDFLKIQIERKEMIR